MTYTIIRNCPNDGTICIIGRAMSRDAAFEILEEDLMNEYELASAFGIGCDCEVSDDRTAVLLKKGQETGYRWSIMEGRMSLYDAGSACIYPESVAYA